MEDRHEQGSGERVGEGSSDAAQPLGKIQPYGDYRKLGQPADTVSGTTQELLEPRGSGGLDALPLAFKVIAVVGIVALVVAIALTQFGPAG